MPVTVNSIKDHSFSKDRSEVILKFAGKYVTEHELKIPIGTLDRFIDSLTRIRGEIGPQPEIKPSKEKKQIAKSEGNGQKPTADKADKNVSVLKPKSWTVATDPKVDNMVVVIFDYQMPTQAGFGLDAKGAKQLSEGIAKYANSLLKAAL